jgi:Mrp family chromosome partitioning ATPase
MGSRNGRPEWNPSRRLRRLRAISLEHCPVLPVFIPQESRLVAVGKEGSLGAEKFRFLAVRLRQLRQSRPLKKVLITSTIPQEGKSTVAANLACTLARRKQHKTLLLEGDLRRPTVSEKFGLGKLPGLCEWLSGETETRNIYRLESLGLWVLPAGTTPQNPLELMQSGKLAQLMDQLQGWFDWIVIDSPPVLPAGGHKHLVPAVRRNPAGHAQGHDREAATAARPGGARKVKTAGSPGE